MATYPQLYVGEAVRVLDHDALHLEAEVVDGIICDVPEVVDADPDVCPVHRSDLDVVPDDSTASSQLLERRSSPEPP